MAFLFVEIILFIFFYFLLTTFFFCFYVFILSFYFSGFAKRSLSNKKKTPGTDNSKRSKRQGGGRADGSESGSRISQAARMRAALAMAEFEMISGGSSAQPPPNQPCNCKKSKCLKLYCEW